MFGVIDNSHYREFEARSSGPIVAAMVACALALSGCAFGGNAIDNAGFDGRALSMAEPTPTVATDPFQPREGETLSETDRLLDEDTLRLAVTTLDLNSIPPLGAPWANATTGTNGRITDIRVREVEGQTCRGFNATRRAYDGVSLYRGEICLDPRNGWWTRSLTNLDDAA